MVLAQNIHIDKWNKIESLEIIHLQQRRQEYAIERRQTL